MLKGKYNIKYFLTSKTLKLKSSYKDWTRIAHVVLADRIDKRDPGNAPQSGDRIEYAAVCVPEKKGMLQGDRIETPAYIKKKNLKIDYNFYIKNQIMNPALQFLKLVLNNAESIFDSYLCKLKNENNKWFVKTLNGKEFETPNIVIAGGVGSFEPRKFPTKSAEKYDGNSVLYSIKDKTIFKDKSVVIFGGGDSALDWSVELSKIAKKIYLVHRRDDFRGAEHTENQMRDLVKDGKIELKIPFVIKSIKGDASFEGVELMHFETKEDEILECDEALFFFGLNKQLGPILDWEIDLDGKKIAVDTENYQTNKEGIFAVGDINTYPGKLDLILCGFHETTIAVQEAYKRINPGKRVPFGYTTSNKGLQEKLGVK